MTTGPWDPEGLVPDDEWARPVRRGRPPPYPPRDPTDPRGQRPAPRRDPTDPRGQRPAARRERRAGAGLPLVPTLAIATALVVFAFVLGRATGGGGDDDGGSVRAANVQTTSTTEELRKHTVKSGESLLGIASQYGVTAEALAAANGITDQNHVFVGQVLTIPSSSIEPIATTTTSTASKTG